MVKPFIPVWQCHLITDVVKRDHRVWWGDRLPHYQRYVEEGLRMDEHPLIRFADGPAGRRARLVGTGKDVWEIIAAVRDNDGDTAETARYLEMPLGLVQAAISYYGAYRDEIDQWIEVNEQQVAEAQAAWSAGQDAVRQ